MNTGKEEYAEIECEKDETNSTCKELLNRPHLLGVGSPLSETLLNATNIDHTTSQEQSLSHNVGIWVWGVYQVVFLLDILRFSRTSNILGFYLTDCFLFRLYMFFYF